jgi:toluene monooxygenase system protein E
MSAQRTYWHLEAARRVPTEYEITSSKLLYYDAARGFEVPTPIQEWHRKFGVDSPLRVSDWGRFRDPFETTYTAYVDRQKERETFVDGLLRSVDESDYDQRLPRSWLAALEALLPVLRYPCHGLLMAAAYLGQMAPESRLVIVHLFQSADELRRIQRFAYRMHQLRRVVPSFGEGSLGAWQTAPVWQPLRRVVETLLVTYDFGEALVALDLVLKPMFDRLVTTELAQLAAESGDPRLGQLLLSLAEDSRRQREIAHEIVRVVSSDREENRLIVAGLLRRWQPRVREALAALTPLLPGAGPALFDAVDGECRSFWATLGLEGQT